MIVICIYLSQLLACGNQILKSGQDRNLLNLWAIVRSRKTHENVHAVQSSSFAVLKLAWNAEMIANVNIFTIYS